MIERVPVKIALVRPDAKIPEYAMKNDAGADIFATSSDGKCSSFCSTGHYAYTTKMNYVKICRDDWVIQPKQTIMINTGLKYDLEPGWELQCRTKSGMALRELVVANSPATLDSGYCGEVCVLIRNNSNEIRVIKPGDKIAQLVLKRVPRAEFIIVDEFTLPSTDRGTGGFGSTGS